ncbi:uncharacterized protein PG986_014451 [Apiospora aurea]|uniref:DUF7492 domain-containing protein n=1 Tax=Apiospora aurea TaxID=335848 RepID=A0ABR1PTD0_9PEZI
MHRQVIRPRLFAYSADELETSRRDPAHASLLKAKARHSFAAAGHQYYFPSFRTIWPDIVGDWLEASDSQHSRAEQRVLMKRHWRARSKDDVPTSPRLERSSNTKWNPSFERGQLGNTSLLSNDNEENQNGMKSVNGLHARPLLCNGPPRILDLGCGTGIWGIDMVDCKGMEHHFPAFIVAIVLSARRFLLRTGCVHISVSNDPGSWTDCGPTLMHPDGSEWSGGTRAGIDCSIDTPVPDPPLRCTFGRFPNGDDGAQTPPTIRHSSPGPPAVHQVEPAHSQLSEPCDRVKEQQYPPRKMLIFVIRTQHDCGLEINQTRGVAAKDPHHVLCGPNRTPADPFLPVPHALHYWIGVSVGARRTSLGLGPIDFEKHDRLASRKQAILKTTFYHVVICLCDGRRHQPPPTGRNASLGILPSDPVCRDTQQAPGIRDPIRLPLKALPSDFIAIQYQETGHVTLPQNTPHKSKDSTVWIYGNSSPSQDDRLLSIHRVWNEAGTGGDGRGVLLASRPFDDGRCYQINNGEISVSRQKAYPKAPVGPQGVDLWCQNDLRLPTNIRETYTLYWVWEWPTIPTDTVPRGRTEIYTSCMDIQILSGLQDERVSYMKGQDLNYAGVEEQMRIS